MQPPFVSIPILPTEKEKNFFDLAQIPGPLPKTWPGTERSKQQKNTSQCVPHSNLGGREMVSRKQDIIKHGQIMDAKGEKESKSTQPLLNSIFVDISFLPSGLFLSIRTVHIISIDTCKYDNHKQWNYNWRHLMILSRSSVANSCLNSACQEREKQAGEHKLCMSNKLEWMKIRKIVH